VVDGRQADRPPERISDLLIREIEFWIAEQPAADVHVADICIQFGLSRRTLQRAFQESLGVGPAHYLILRRLSSARSRLLDADPATERVTDVAVDEGFWELGRFAVRYREMFGERPSETLRRAPERRWR
jgi:AraC family ethanolamine operon transcriptional activator